MFQTRRGLKGFVSLLPLLSVAGIVCFVVVQALRIAYIHTHHWSYSIDFLTDDAYYYLGVAWNVAHDHVSQFRAPLQTNGYQPLWLVLLSAFELVTNGSKKFLVEGTIFLSAAAILIAWVLAHRTKVVSSLAVVVAVFAFPFVFLLGQETVLMLPLVLLLAISRERNSRLTFVLYAALFYVRLDALAVLPVFLAYDFFFKKKPITALLKETAGVVLLIAPYFVYNYVQFGVPVPISGLTKSLGNKPGENIGLLSAYFYSAIVPIITVLGTWCVRRISRTKSRNDAQDLAILFLVVLAICGVYYSVFSGWPVWGWYFWPSAIAEVFALSAFIGALGDGIQVEPTSSRSNAALAVAVIVVGFLTANIASRFFIRAAKDVVIASRPGTHETFGTMNAKTIQNVLENRSGDDFVAMGDRAGSLGYWMPVNQKFINLEGLVASKEYYEAMKNGMAIDFLRKLGVTLLVVERPRYLASPANGDSFLAVPEPINGFSAHTGPYVMCFPANAILYQRSYRSDTRYIVEFGKVQQCPADVAAQFNSLRNTYGALNASAFSADPGGAARPASRPSLKDWWIRLFL